MLSCQTIEFPPVAIPMKILGIDLGAARVGLALSDDLGMLAHPLETITVKTTAVLPRIAEVVGREKVTRIVLGLPRNMDGSYGPAAEKTRAFAAKLQETVPGCAVTLWDERLTSVAAQKALHENGRTVKQSRPLIDQVAAQLILQGWLDSQEPQF